MKAFLHSLFREHKRQKLTLLVFSFAAVLLFNIGIFSFFSGTDTVSNRMTGKSGSVALLEPAWDREGQYKAAKAEPGMTIPKNPYAYNDGQVDIYVRLVMTVKLGDFDTTGKTDAYKARYNTDSVGRDRRRLFSIANALQFVSGDTVVPFLTLDASDDNVRNWTITDCANNSFVPDAVNRSDSDDKLIFYFYYTAGDKDGSGDLMRIVKPNESTAELFQRVDIPIFKEDYFGVFDQKFDIKIEAQAIPAGNYPDGLTVDEAIAEFKNAE